MKTTIIILITLTLVTACSLLAYNSGRGNSLNREGVSEMPGTLSEDSLINRGKYLVNIMGCNDCHSPMIMTPRGPGIDSSKMLSGFPVGQELPAIDETNVQGYSLFSLAGTAITGPWGTSYAANLTSDETGIGNWSEAQFFKAIREGKYKGLDNARSLLPPMPWRGYAQASDEDLRAIFTYLKSTPPIENRVPAPIPPNQLGRND